MKLFISFLCNYSFVVNLPFINFECYSKEIVLQNNDHKVRLTNN